MDSYSGSNLQLFVDIARQEMLSSKYIAMAFNFVKKARNLYMLRKLSFPLKVSENVSDKYSVLKYPCYKMLGL